MCNKHKTLYNFITAARYCLFLFLSLVLGISALIHNPTYSHAQGAAAAAPIVAPSGCDPEYMDALEARAWMEAQREISMNQSLITKPDSVFEYTCFDKILSNYVSMTGQLFSDNGGPWGVAAAPGQTSGQIISSLVYEPIQNYLTENFGHNYLGDRISQGYFPMGSLGAGGYSCSEMNVVWGQAQCKNFFDQNETDGFRSFKWWSENDPRHVPDRDDFIVNGCSNVQAVPAGSANLSNYINGDGDTVFADFFKIAYNNDTVPYDIENELDTTISNTDILAVNSITGNLYAEDPIQTFLSLMLPPGSLPTPAPQDCNAVVPIPTGIVVHRNNFDPEYYMDKVCPAPGCYYKPTTSPGTTASAPQAAGTCEP